MKDKFCEETVSYGKNGKTIIYMLRANRQNDEHCRYCLGAIVSVIGLLLMYINKIIYN